MDPSNINRDSSKLRLFYLKITSGTCDAQIGRYRGAHAPPAVRKKEGKKALVRPKKGGKKGKKGRRKERKKEEGRTLIFCNYLRQCRLKLHVRFKISKHLWRKPPNPPFEVAKSAYKCTMHMVTIVLKGKQEDQPERVNTIERLRHTENMVSGTWGLIVETDMQRSLCILI